MIGLVLFLPLIAHATLSGDLEAAIRTNNLFKAEMILRNLPPDQPLAEASESADILYSIYVELYKTRDPARTQRLEEIAREALERGANPNRFVTPYVEEEFMPASAADRILYEWLHARDTSLPLRTDGIAEERVAEVARKMIDLFFEYGVFTAKSTIFLGSSAIENRRIGLLEWLMRFKAAPELAEYFWAHGLRESVYDEEKGYNFALVLATLGDVSSLRYARSICDASTTARMFDFQCAKSNYPTPLVGALNAVGYGVPAETAIEIMDFLVAHGADPSRRIANFDLIELARVLQNRHPFRKVELRKVEEYLLRERLRLHADFERCRSALLGELNERASQGRESLEQR